VATVSPKLTIPHTVRAGAIVGQGNQPEFVARLSYSDASDPSPTWVDVTADVRSFAIARGRGSEFDEVDAGTVLAGS